MTCLTEAKIPAYGVGGGMNAGGNVRKNQLWMREQSPLWAQYWCEAWGWFAVLQM